MPITTTSFKTSPMAFVKRLAVLEIFFAFLTFITRYYNLLRSVTSVNLPPQNPLELSFITITIISIIQIVFIILIFLSWYLEKYSLTKKALTFSRTDAFKKTLIPNISTVTAVQINQGRIAQSLNYGSLIFYTNNQEQTIIHNIPNPHYQTGLIRTQLAQLNPSPITLPDQPLKKLLKSSEGQHLEFKASLQWDYQQNKVNKDLHKPVMKSVAAFLNTSGGTLLIGVSDKGKLVGLEKDLATMSKKSTDGWENTFTMTVKKTMGIEHMRHLQVIFETQAKHTVAKIIIQPSPKPVFVITNGLEEFYIRTGNSSQPLSVSKTVEYIQEHFSK